MSRKNRKSESTAKKRYNESKTEKYNIILGGRKSKKIKKLKNLFIEHNAYKYYKYGGHPAPAGRALPNLINAVSMFKVKVNVNTVFDFNILTA